MASAFTDPQLPLTSPTFQPEMAFPVLSDAMIETIRAYTSEAWASGGTVMFSRNHRGTDMIVVFEGKVSIYSGEDENTSEAVIDLGPNQFTGELNILND